MEVGFLDAVEILSFPCTSLGFDTNNALKCSASPCLMKALLNEHWVFLTWTTDTSDSSLSPFSFKQIWLKSAPSTPQANQGLWDSSSHLAFNHLTLFFIILFPLQSNMTKLSQTHSQPLSVPLALPFKLFWWNDRIKPGTPSCSSSRPEVRLSSSLESKGFIDLL